MSNFYSIYDDLKRADLKFNDGKCVLASIWPRRIGKSTACNKLMIDNWEKHQFTKKCLYIRNTLEEIKAFARTFNVMNQGQYIIQGTHIYKIFMDEITGREIKSKRIIVGIAATISTFSKIKSQLSDTNFNLVVYDEFNGIDGAAALDAQTFYKQLPKNQYFSFLELIASIEGDSDDLLVIMMGNKVDSQNDILLCWGIEIPEKAPETYQLSICDKNVDGTNFKIRFINGGYKEYESLHKGKQLFKALATYDKQCERYFNNNDFYKKQGKNVVSRVRMENVEGDIQYLALNENLITFKTTEDDILYFYESWEEVEETEEIYPLNFQAFAEFSNCINWERDDQAEWALNLIDAIKDERVYFASNWIKYNIICWIGKLVSNGIF